MATDHDFKIKNGARVSGEKLILGSSAFSQDANYVGLKTSAMTGSAEYMIISAPTDKHTYISAGSGRSVYIRGGGNNSAHQLVVSAAGASFAGDLTVSGNFTVSGTTTTLNTATLNVEDKNITLNYGSGDTSGSANGSGITIQDAMAVNHDATILWDTSNDRFNFSDPVNVDIVGPNNTPSADALTVAGYGIIGNRSASVYVTNSNSNGTVQIGVGGAHNSNPKLTVSSSTATFTVPITSTYFLSSLADSTPAGTTFANAFNGSTRVAYFDGDTTTSVWWGSGNTPYAAIDATNGNLKLYVNDTNGNWHQKIGLSSTGATHYGNVTTTGNYIALDSTGYAFLGADGATNEWKYLSLRTNGTTNWDVATKNNDLSGALQFRPGGGSTNRTYMDTSGNWVFNGRLTNTDTAEGQKVVLNFDTGGNMILGHDGSYGNSGNGRYITLAFGGTTNGSNRIFAHNSNSDGMYFAAATGRGFYWRPNGSSSNSMVLGSSGQLTVNSGNVQVRADTSYGSSYGTVGFGGTGTGYNRISGRNSADDGLFLHSATGRHIYFRTGGSTSNTFTMTSGGQFQVGSTTVIDSSRNLTNIGTITNSGKISSSIGSNATYSRPLLEITSSATPTQIKITTNILYSGTGASTHAHSVRISGFQYGSAQMADLQIGWHVYQNQFYNRSVTSSGSWAPTVTLAVENNKVVIHLASPGYWPKLYVESMYNAYGGAGQASGWSWSDAAISADANTPNQTVPYKSNFGNSFSMDSSGNVAVGTTSHTGKLSVSGQVNHNVADFYSGTTQANLNIGRSSAQRFNMYVTDGTGFIRYYQDETDSTDHSVHFQIQSSSSGTNQFYFNKGANITGNLVVSSAIRANDWYRGASNTNTLYSDTSNGTILQSPSNTNNAAGTIYMRDSSGVVHFSLNTNTNVSSFHGGTISSGAITSTGTSTFNNFRLTDSSKMGFGTVRAGASVGHTATTEEGIFWHTGTDYGIYRTSGTWSSPNYQQLKMYWTTGIQLDGGTAYGKSGVDLVNNTVLKINGTAVTNSSGQWIGGLNPSTLDITHSSADSVLRIAHGAANTLDAVIQLSGSASDMAAEGAEIWYDNSVGDVHIATTYPNDDAYIRFHTRTGASKSTSNERLTIAGHGTVGINKSSGLNSSYKLHMGGHIHLNNNHIHYVNELHFNNNTRFRGDGSSYTMHRAGSSTTSGIQFDTNGTTRGYVLGNSDSGHSIGFLDQGGSWAVRHINDQGTAFYSDGGTERASIGADLVGGDYGSMVVKESKGGWAGYSINNQWVFMSEGSGRSGIYNDTDNEWAAQFYRNGQVSLYHNNSIKLSTTSGGIDVAGNVEASGSLSVRDKLALDMPSNSSSERGPWNPIASSIRSSGRMLYKDEEFWTSANSIGIYNNSGGGTVVHTREADTVTLGADAPNGSGMVIRIYYNGGTASPGFGGFLQTIPSEDNHTFVQIFQAKLPSGKTLQIAENAQGTNNQSYFLTSNAGTGKWEWYARVSHCGDSGTFSGGGHIYVTGGSGAFTWYLASCTVYDVTETPAAAKLELLNDQRNLDFKTDSTSSAGLLVRAANNGFRFQLYGDGTHYGFLDGAWANWDLKKTTNGKLTFNGNDSYFLQPEHANSAKFRSYVQIGDSSSYNSNSGSWGARLNVTDDVHSKIVVAQDADSMESHWYAHTGHSSIKFGTSSSHDVEFQRAGSTLLELEPGGTLFSVPIRRNSHHASGFLEGSYNSVGNNNSKTNPIYTIGSSYNPAETALSNMYGIGYTRGDVSFLSTPFTGASNWGMYVAADGDARIFLDAQAGQAMTTHGYVVGSTTVIDSSRNVTGNELRLENGWKLTPEGSGYAKVSSWVRMEGTGIYTTSTTHVDLDDGSASWSVRGTSNQDLIRVSTADSNQIRFYANAIHEGGIRRNNHHTGYLEGSYNNVAANSAKTNPIYTIGSNYLPTATSFSNMYGIGYSHSNMWGTSNGRASGWGLYVVENGTTNFMTTPSRTWSAGEYYRNGNKVWDAGNDGPSSGLDADTVDGKHASDFMEDQFLDSAYVDFTVNGDADTYYPVSIRGGGVMAFQMYSISRQYNWTAPNTWYTSTHRGGLTLTWQYSGDGFWGGNDHDVRIIKWDETYSTMVAGMQGSVGGGGTNAGVVVWLRGGGALYRFHGPQASAGDVNIHLSSVTASNSTVFAPRSLNTTTRDNELLPKYPIRNQSELYDNNNRVWNPANDGPGSGLDADTVDGIQAASTLHKLNNTGYYRPNDWIDFRDAGTAGLYWGAGTASGWHLYPANTGIFKLRSGDSSYVQIDLTCDNDTRRGALYADSSSNVGILDDSGHWAIRHINHSGTEFRKANTVIAGIGSGEVTGDYGGMVIRDAKNGWYGYSINNQWVFMANGSSVSGIYNDTDNEWAVRTTRNAATELYYNGGVRIATSSGGAYVTGEVEASNFKAYTGGHSYYYTSSGNLRGYVAAFETGPHLRIATSGNEQIGFYDGGTSGTLNVLIEGGGHVDLKTGNLNMNGTTVINTSRILQNVTLGYGPTGSRFQVSGWIDSNDGNDRMYFASGSTSYWKCGGTGSHIWRNGSDVSRAELDSSGNFIAEGNVTAYGSASDIRIKENIEIIPDSVEKVNSLRGVTFNYKKDGKRSTGLVAQELQKVLPEAVYETKDAAEDGEDILAIRYGNVVGLLVEAIKEQQTQIDSLTKLVNELKEK